MTDTHPSFAAVTGLFALPWPDPVVAVWPESIELIPDFELAQHLAEDPDAETAWYRLRSMIHDAQIYALTDIKFDGTKIRIWVENDISAAVDALMAKSEHLPEADRDLFWRVLEDHVIDYTIIALAEEPLAQAEVPRAQPLAAEMLKAYAAGAWPCGWRGVYPQGRLCAYRLDLKL